MSSPRRFIAGAICPACGLMDKLVLYRAGDGRQLRECVRCGFSEPLDDGPIQQPAPSSRLERARPGEPALPGETPVERVRLIEDDGAEEG